MSLIIDGETGEIFEPDDVQAICRQIRARWQDSVEAILDVSQMLVQAKTACKHGEWQWMFDDKNPDRLPFNRQNAHKLMVIARSQELVNVSHGRQLPSSWRTLYELSSLSDDKIRAAIETGQINPDMERKDVKALLYGHGEDEGQGDEWYTPMWLFDALGLHYEIDVCGPVDRTHVTTPCSRHFTEADDGLAQEWDGLIWCNPPYSTPEPWATKTIEHGNGLLLTHIPMNAGWASAVWQACDGLRLFQAIEFVRPDGEMQRPGMWLQLAAFGEEAFRALELFDVPETVATNPRRVPSPLLVPSK